MIEKVRILEKDFPRKIPEDIGNKPLEVVNESGKSVALFFNISFMGKRFQDPMEFIRHHDDIFNYWNYWQSEYWADGADMVEPIEEFLSRDAEQFKEVRVSPVYDWSAFYNFRYLGRSMVALCRAVYPYHLRNLEKVLDCIDNDTFGYGFKYGLGNIDADFLYDYDYENLEELICALEDENVFKKYIDISDK